MYKLLKVTLTGSLISTNCRLNYQSKSFTDCVIFVFNNNNICVLLFGQTDINN